MNQLSVLIAEDEAILAAHLASKVKMLGYRVIGRPRPGPGDLRSTSPESVAMARDLKKLGFRFFGPTTAYAMMQAIGLVDDHVDGCFAPPPAWPD